MKAWLLTRSEVLAAMKEADFEHASDLPFLGVLFEDGACVAEYHVNGKAEEYARFNIHVGSSCYQKISIHAVMTPSSSEIYREFYDRREKNVVRMIRDDPATLELIDVFSVVTLRYRIAEANGDVKLNALLREVCREQIAKAKFQSTINILNKIRRAALPYLEFERAGKIINETLSYENEYVVV